MLGVYRNDGTFPRRNYAWRVLLFKIYKDSGEHRLLLELKNVKREEVVSA